MRKVYFTLIFISSLLLQANEVETSNNQWLQDLQVLVKLSSANVNAIKGNDQNSNGVRDDVEAYVLSKYENDPFQKDMFFSAAKKIQEIITLPASTSLDRHVTLDRELLEIYTCRDYILYRNESENIDQELLNKTLFKGKVLNTPERLKAYIEHKKKLPLEFDALSEQELMQDKKSCLARYYSYDNPKEKSVSLLQETNAN